MTNEPVDPKAVEEFHGRRIRSALDENRGADAAAEFQKYLDRIGRRTLSRAVHYRRSLLQPKEFEAELPYIATARGVLLESAYWMLFADGMVYSDETMQRRIHNHPWVRTRSTADRMQYVFEMPLSATPIAEPTVLLGGDGNYSHWVMRCLARLWLLRDRPDLTDLPILTRKSLTPVQRAMLDRLGIGRRVNLNDTGLYECREVHVPVCPRGRPWSKSALRWLRSRLMTGVPARTAGRRLFVSRNDAQWRRLLNEEELREVLEPLGFEWTTPGALSFDEQISLFAEAGVVVGGHGAGLTNILFSPPGARVLEISDSYMRHITDFRQIADAVGLRHEVVVSTDVVEPAPEFAHYPHKYHAFRVDVPAIAAAVHELLRN